MTDNLKMMMTLFCLKNNPLQQTIPVSPPKYLLGIVIFSLLFLSGCVLAPFTSSAPSNYQALEKKPYFKPTLISQAQPYNKDSYSQNTTYRQAPDLTPEEHSSADINRSFHPVIWNEMQHQFHLSIEHLGQYESQIEYFRKNPNYLSAVSKRAQPYLHYILSQVQLRNMPYEIALLPIIESGFQPTARSNKEAGGLWQFIPSTARIFGLKQDEWYDGRQDIQQSTQAALDYLQELYRLNNNDWLLALASYNAGPGTIQRAIKKYNQKQGGEITSSQPDFWAIQPYLPQETQDYVPKLLAVSHVINHIDHFDITLEPIENAPFFAEVQLPKQVHLTKVMQLAQIPKDTFKQLNAGYLAQTTPPDGPHTVLLPRHKVEAFQKKVGATSDLFNIQWVKHKIKTGESLSVIAQRYHTTQTAIKKINQMKSSRLRAGKTLLIPIPAQQKTVLAKASSKKADKELKTPTPSKKHVIKHTVKAGDSLWSIAQKYKISSHTLAKWNQLKRKTPLKIGQTLSVYVSQKPTQAKPRFARYKIKSGDSLWKIAKKNKVSTEALASYNNLSPNAYLKPGQILKIPIRG